MSLIPQLTATPNGDSPYYNPGMAETFSWVPINGANRPLFAKATYDITSNAPIQNGATYIAGVALSSASMFGATYWSRIVVVGTSTTISLTATNWDGNTLAATAIPAGTTLYGIFTSIQLGAGSVIAYKG